MAGSWRSRARDGLVEWNASLGGAPLDPPLDGALIVAYDAIGGFFALNGGLWDAEPGAVFYFAPDTFACEALDGGYSDVLAMLLSARFEGFYDGRLWPGWESEVAGLGPDQAISIWPALAFKGGPIAERDRRPVPARSILALGSELGRQMSSAPPGTRFEIRFR